MKNLFTKIYKVTGVIIFILGTTFAAKAQDTRSSIATGVWASAVARDGSGNIYVVENPGFGTSAEVLKYTGGKGAPTTIYTADLDDNGGLLDDYAFGLAVTSNGDVYLSTAPDDKISDGRIIRLVYNSTNGTYTPTTFLTGFANGSTVSSFTSLAVDANDNLFVIQTDFGDPDSNPLEVAKYTASGGVPQAGSFTILYNFSIVTNDNYTAPVGLAVDAGGNVYVAEPFNMSVPGADGGHVVKLTKSSGYSASQFTSGQYTSTLGSDPLGNIYATTSTYTSNGTYIPFSLVEYAGGSASSAVTLYTGLGGGDEDFFPFGIAALSPTDVFVADGFETLDPTPQHNPVNGNFLEIIGSPTTQASNVSFSNITENSATINWANGGGSSRAVFIAASTSGNVSLTNGTLYTANTAFGTGTAAGAGWYCVYNSSGSTNSVNISGLSASTGYTVMTVEYNGSTGYQNYLTTTATGNPNTFTTSADNTPPAISSITSTTPTNASPTNATSVTYTVTFNEAVTGVDNTDFTATTSGVSTTDISVTPVSSTVYTVTVNGISGTGTLRLDLNGGGTGITDQASTGITGGFTGADTYAIDQTAPSVSSITATNPTDANPTNATSVTFTITFSEAVTGVDNTDFTATTSGVSTTGISVTPVSSTVYTATVSGISGTGTLRIDLNNSGTGITDAAGNAISGGFIGGDTYTVDQTAPTITAITASGTSPTNATSTGYTVTFSEAVTGVDATDFIATTTGVSTTGINVIPLSGSVYTATINGVSGNGTVRLDLNSSGTGITDQAGNAISGGFTDGDTYSIDNTAPTVVISAPSVASISSGAGNVTFTVTYSDANFNASTLSALDITLNTTGTAGGTVEVSNSGTTSTVTISGITGSGTLGISVGAGTASDLAGNSAPASGPSSTFTVISSDATLSDLAISSGTLSPSFAGGITNYTVLVSTVKKDHTVFTMGDSITANGEYQITLASLLSGVFTFVNFGIIGNETFDMLNRFSGVTDESPDYVIILGGINDITNGYTAAQVETNLQTMYTAAHNAGIKVIALTITPWKGNVNWTAGKQTIQNEINAWIPTAKNIDYVIDTYTPLVDPSNAQQLLPVYDIGDHLHLNKAGQNEIAKAIYNGAVFTPSLKIDQTNADTSVNVTPVTTDANATVTVNGVTVTSGSASVSIPLNVGLNTINTVVTAQDGIAVKTYTLMVLRKLPAAPMLSNLTTSNTSLSPLYTPEITNYTASVTDAVTSLTVTPTTSNITNTITVNNTKVTSGSATASIPLNLGANTISTVVTAADGTTQTYTITVTQASNNAQLASLKLNPGSALTLTSGVGFEDLTASVSNATATVTVTPVADDATAIITVNGTLVTSGTASGNISLAVGANIITTMVTAQDGITTRTYSITVTRAASSNALLSAIKLTPASTLTNTGTIGSTTSYTTSVSNATTSVTITPTTLDPNATLTVNGIPATPGAASAPIALASGQTTITTVVTAQDGTTTRTYSITVTRTASSNALLSAIKLTPASTLTNTGTIGSTTSYTTSVTNATTSVTITPTTVDPNATLTVNGIPVSPGTASAPIALASGQTTITTVVTAQDGTTTRTYLITVTRAASSNALLSAIKLTPASTLTNTGTIGSTTSYTTSVTNATTSVTITPTTVDPNATLTVNGIPVSPGTASAPIALASGQTTITTVVTAQDGTTTRTYSITVTRTASSNALLSAIKLTPASTLTNTGTIGSTTSYTTSVTNATTSVTITPTTVDPNATLTVNGIPVSPGTASAPIALASGQTTITTVVTAQDGTTTRTYLITVTRAASSNALLSAIKLTPASTLTNTGTIGSTTSYTTSVTNATTSVTITPTTVDPNATLTVNGIPVSPGTASAPIALASGQTTITTVVTAQDGTTTRTYLITVTRAASSNALLSAIKLTPASTLTNTGTIGSTTSYTTSVTNATTSVTITPTTVDPNATVTVTGIAVTSGTPSGNIALAVGQTTITAIVTAQDRTTTHTYSITITRATGALMSLYLPVSVVQPTDTVLFESDGVMVHQGVSPNGDGINDVLTIDGIAAYPENHLTIVDRNGSLIFQAKGYDNSLKAFDGHSNVNGRLLQAGTYFYSLDYVADGLTKHKTGYILLKY